ncbi:putative zinc-binding protein [Pseudogulbenkiania subflava]|uniref:Uncharacterized protein, contains metal-binding DGC domain n=1 Tax=Pseudogulbenkiania subflava DSM 22618 TaxID=1123014 RepID=A0A1Y6BIU8_9NEIS|nr:putative zinc-binding protein [Pseudogulbenkiania subflava]SMF06004.1 Uncharacterized protein, contains metal-binding DGC domain [Pseudogulbenkiania subflava DSM 22618]
MKAKTPLPLVYACSGCSSAAQMANDFALKLTREGLAEMSCISGVGGGVPALVRLARSGRPVLALDGCPLACVKACLANAGVSADRHVVLSEFGVVKRKHHDYDAAEAERLWPRIQTESEALADQPRGDENKG